MTDYPQRVSDSFNERLRLIRLRRRKERLRFWQEFRIIPGWLIGFVIVLFFAAQAIAMLINLKFNNGDIFPPEFKDDPVMASFLLGLIVTGVSLVLATMIFLFAFVNRYACRRGMNSELWTILVLVLLPAWGTIGFIIYFLMREPMPYNCPQCATTVGARFNFCPNCKCNLHPSCPNCKREVVETDKFCPYCGSELSAPAGSGAAIPAKQA
jgi:RNA polymerase subunit RPABC4/transcription elongation factor Spt4